MALGYFTLLLSSRDLDLRDDLALSNSGIPLTHVVENLDQRFRVQVDSRLRWSSDRACVAGDYMNFTGGNAYY
jgi:hypothetical protein